MLAFSFCWIADGVHTLLYGDRWPCFVYNIPVDFLGNFLLFQVSVSYRLSLFFPWGISTKGDLGRHHGSEKQLFWVSFYIILINKSEHRLLLSLPVRCSQDHISMFVRTGVKVQPMGKWCSWRCSKAFHFLIALCSFKRTSRACQAPWLHGAVAGSTKLLKNRSTCIWGWRTGPLNWVGAYRTQPSTWIWHYCAACYPH